MNDGGSLSAVSGPSDRIIGRFQLNGCVNLRGILHDGRAELLRRGSLRPEYDANHQTDEKQKRGQTEQT